MSVALHVAGGAALFAIRPGKRSETIAIEMSDAKKPPKKPAPTSEPPPPPPPAQREPARPRAAPPVPVAPQQNATPAPPTAPRAFDLGMSNQSGGGPGGVGIPDGPTGAPQAPASASAKAPETREVANTLGGPTQSADDCAEPLVKPSPKSVPQPAYPEAARADGISGKVRVEVTVDASGAVASARVISGLGHGLDESALAAARSAKFSPATKCGKPTTATFVIGMRFSQ